MSKTLKELNELLGVEDEGVIDPEDITGGEMTRARMVEKANTGADQEEVMLAAMVSSKQKLKNRSVFDELAEDPRYHGKVADDNSDEEESDYNESNDDGMSANEIDDDDDEEIDSDEAMGEEDDIKMPDKISIFGQSKSSAESRHMKQRATKRQLKLWDTCMEWRIKGQKVVNKAASLPLPDNFAKFVAQSSDSQKEADKMAHAVNDLQAVLMQVQLALATKVKGFNIDNSTENGGDASESDEVLKKRNSSLAQFRHPVLKYWYDKTRLAGGGGPSKSSFDSLERPTNDQIAQILSDQERLMNRLHLRRTNMPRLGDKPKGDDEDQQKQHDQHLQDNDDENFDETDFYQQQVRQLIEHKTATKNNAAANGSDVNSEIEMTRHWLKLQKLQKKSKKVVDTKASKGRKVRYHVHKKLVSFMSSQDNSSWNDGKINQMSRVLFGKYN